MTKTIAALVLSGLFTAGSLATESAKDTKEDVARHRAIAAAHEAAAQCREAGRGEDACNTALQAACKGIAIGKYCGMKHEH